MIGQDAVATAHAFQEGVDVTGVVLTKLDGDARGGAALSVREVTGVPILFASTGEKVTDFEAFHPDRMASRILDMGDVLTLIEQAQKTVRPGGGPAHGGEGERRAKTSHSRTSWARWQQLKNMGSMKKMLTMLPGMGQMRDEIDNFDEKELARTEAIIQSMTPAERDNPKVLNGSRRSRIAQGSGTTVTADQLAGQALQRGAEDDEGDGKGGRRRSPAWRPGWAAPGPAAATAAAKARQAGRQQKVKGKSGNPAKRAQQEAEARRRLEERSSGAAAGQRVRSAARRGRLDPSPELPSFMKKR